MQIFVTGGTGFLGQRLLERLRRDGHSVRALSRSRASDELLRGLGAEPISGSLEDIERWEAALDGQQALVHAASPVEFWGPWEKFEREIFQATSRLYQACGRHGVARMIYISSESVLQDRAPLLDIDETQPYPAEPNSYYGKAKKLAELDLLRSPSPTMALILRPSFLWGRGVKTVEAMLAKIKSGQFAWVDHGRTLIEHTHVDNAVEAIVLALTGGRDKQVYFVTDGGATPVKTLLSALIKTQGVTPPTRSMPRALLAPLASLVEGLWRLLRIKKTPPLSRFELAFVAMPRSYRIDKIARELGYRPVVSLEQGLAEMSAPQELATAP